MTEHTPTPWRVEQDTDLIWGGCDPDDNSTRGMGYSIVEGKSASWNKGKPDMDEREANAAFIVKAVNNHDRLIQALQFVVDGYDNQDVNHVDFRVRVYEVALDALASVAARPFYGAECPSYPNCKGGCGLGCTKEIERSKAHKSDGAAP